MAKQSAAAVAAETATSSSGRTFKRPSGDLPQLDFIRPSKLTDNDAGKVLVEGLYLGPVANEMTKKNDFKFQLENGSQVIINGAGNLGYRMSNIATNTVVQVIYSGRNKIAKGPMAGKMSHGFSVLIAE